MKGKRQYETNKEEKGERERERERERKKEINIFVLKEIFRAVSKV